MKQTGSEKEQQVLKLNILVDNLNKEKNEAIPNKDKIEEIPNKKK